MKPAVLLLCLASSVALWSACAAAPEKAVAGFQEAGAPAAAGLAVERLADGLAFQTRHARIKIDANGYVASIVDRVTGKEYSPAGRPSPLLSLHEGNTPNSTLVLPKSAAFDGVKRQISLSYPNGAVAVVQANLKESYLRFQLVSLEPRGTVDNVVWGPLNTTVSGRIGDIIGVVRDENFAIGLYGLDDNTIPGRIEEGDCYGMGYFIHSPDPKACPIPEKYQEGQWFNIGGDGVSDTAFYSHPEDYFNQVFGSGAKVEPEFGSSISYYSRDRRQSYVHFYSLLPGFKIHERKHMVSDPLPGVDFLGSAIALYACPDTEGVKVLEQIFKGENLVYVTDRDGKWIRDPAAARPTLYWNGPVDKAIEYAKAMGFKDISRDTGEFYSSRPSGWTGHLSYQGKSITYKEFSEMCHKEGLTHGGLHTLCMFLQGGISRDVTPVPNENLLTVCRTKLAKDLSPTDTEIVVADPSFLAESGTWPKNGDGQNYIRVGGEMMMYKGISAAAPWTLTGVKRGHASTAAGHKAGDELVKLQQNCYNGFVPDMKLMLDYADDYVDLMVRNGMDTINFDGYETMAYTNHGYYAFNVFNRRLFEGYHAKTGHWPRVTGSNIFGGAWAYFNVCDLGGGRNMYLPEQGRRNIEAKDIGNAFTACWFPGTFGIQGLPGTLVDAENMMAKAIGWDSTFALSVDQAGIDRIPERDAIFAAFNAWQQARELQLFTRAQKARLRDPALKFHLERTGAGRFLLRTVQEIRRGYDSTENGTAVPVANAGGEQPLQFMVQPDVAADGADLVLPDGSTLRCDQKIERLQFIVCKGGRAYLADSNLKKLADLTLEKPPRLPAGEGKVVVKLRMKDPAAKIRFGFWSWTLDAGESLGQIKN